MTGNSFIFHVYYLTFLWLWQWNKLSSRGSEEEVNLAWQLKGQKSVALGDYNYL